MHTGNLGKHCARRHCLGGWELWELDHGKEYNFVLSDGHGRLVCEACRRRPPGEVKFARQCDRGHSTGSWKSAQVL